MIVFDVARRSNDPRPAYGIDLTQLTRGDVLRDRGDRRAGLGHTQKDSVEMATCSGWGIMTGEVSAGLAIPVVQRLGRTAITVGVLGAVGQAGDQDREQDDH